MTAASDPQIVPESQPVSRCAGVASCRPGRGLRPWSPSFPTTPGASTAPSGGCSTTGATSRLRSLPAEPLTVARYLAVRAGDGASIATMRLTTFAIAKVHEWAGHESPGKDRACATL